MTQMDAFLRDFIGIAKITSGIWTLSGRRTTKNSTPRMQPRRLRARRLWSTKLLMET